MATPGGAPATAGNDRVRYLYPRDQIFPPPKVSGPFHAVDHLLGGAQEIDGDKIGIDFAPSNYTPTTSPPEASDIDHLAAHLGGIDNRLLTGIADTNLVRIDSVSVASGEYAKFTANGLESKSFAEVLVDLSGTAGAAFNWNTQNLTGIVDIALSGDIDFSGTGDITSVGNLTLTPTGTSC